MIFQHYHSTDLTLFTLPDKEMCRSLLMFMLIYTMRVLLVSENKTNKSTLLMLFNRMNNINVQEKNSIPK